MNKKQLLYHGSLLVTIWFEYFIVVSIIAMFIYHKDLKNRIIQAILLVLVFYFLSKDIEVSSKVITTTFLIVLMFFYEPFKEWRDNRSKL